MGPNMTLFQRRTGANFENVQVPVGNARLCFMALILTLLYGRNGSSNMLEESDGYKTTSVV